MREPAEYWLRRGPAIPEVTDLPQGTFRCDERAWSSLSPGMRREIWRDAIYREGVRRQLAPDILSRLRVATIDGSLGSLDEYLAEFDRKDAARPAIPEDAERMSRADTMHRRSEVQIAAREML